jgi:DNA-binding transcriptional regulator YiaG
MNFDFKQARKGKLITKEQIERLYVGERLDFPAVARALNISKTTVSELLREYSIPVRPAGRPRFVPVTKQSLARLYKSHTQTEIAQMFGKSVSSVRSWLKYYGIKRK